MMLLLQIYTSYSLCYVLAANNIPWPPIKRAAAIAIINIGANLPNTYVPYLFYTGSSPHFYTGFGFCIAFLVLAALLIVVIRFHLARLNKKLERGEIVDGIEPETYSDSRIKQLKVVLCSSNFSKLCRTCLAKTVF